MHLSDRSAVLAFDVGGTTIKAEVLTEDLEVLAAAHVSTPRGPAVVEAVASLGESVLAGLPADRRRAVARAGVAVPGIVDLDGGTIVYAANLGVRDLPMAGPLSHRWDLPVDLGHDVTAAAEAERRRGAASEIEDPFVVVIGTGIAAVSYVHGRRVIGVCGQAGELGHVVVRPEGPPCACGGRGCLEAVASASAVSRAYRDASGHALSAHEVVDLLGRDRIADQVWAEATAALGDALLAVAALLAPGVVVLGGGLAEAGDRLLDPVTSRMRANAPMAVSVPPLRLAALGSRAGVVGAGLLALDGTAGR